MKIRVGETLRGAGLGSAEEEGERLVQDRGLAEPAYELLVLGVRLDKAVVLGPDSASSCGMRYAQPALSSAAAGMERMAARRSPSAAGCETCCSAA